jgi:DNA-binding NarL/FixJ family response regulator
VKDVSSIKEIPKGYNTKAIHLVIFDPTNVSDEFFAKVQQRFNSSRIMILTYNSDRENVMKYMELGISGFFSKEDCPSQLENSIQDISNNYAFEEVRLGSVVRESLMSDVGFRKKKKIQFSKREIQILRLVCNEKTNLEISEILGLSIRTIESHRRRMIDKTDCRSIIGVILNALELKSLNLNVDIPSENGHKAS